jgi:hypothetical protein
MAAGMLNIVVPIRSDRVEALAELLREIGLHIDDNPHVRFHALTRVHFARWVILPPGPDGVSLLAFESNHDGTAREHLRELVGGNEAGVFGIYAHCARCPDPARGAEALVDYLLAHTLPSAATYAAYRSLTVAEIRRAASLRQEVEVRLDRLEASGLGNSRDEMALGAALRAALPRAADRQAVPSAVARWIRLAGLGLLAILLSPLWFPVVLVWLPLLRRRETTDPQSSPVTPPNVATLRAREDHQVQNQLTHLVPVKPGRLRWATVRVVLWTINLLSRAFFTQGTLGSIPSIHFARWVLLPDGRLLFFSNYDGSWENYLGDFIDRASVGLTSVWSNTEGFPRTRFLAFEGARREGEFKSWARACQVETQVWYAAYDDLTVPEILANRRLHNALVQPLPADADIAAYARL